MEVEEEEEVEVVEGVCKTVYSETGWWWRGAPCS